MSKLNKAITLGVCAGMLLGVAGTTGVINNSQVATVEAAQTTNGIKVSQKSALNKFNQKFANKQVSEINLEKNGNKYVYEISGFDSSNEYEMEINAQTGKVISSSKDQLDTDDSYSTTALDTSKTISRNEASKIAEKVAKKGASRSWDLKQEDQNLAVWEVKVGKGNNTKEVTINAQTKKILNVVNDYD